ncbi:NtaA/DmoA family FMN-dependent monooxygenase [Streptomyces barringtoniae]|uniref:NtaA/DmoA family FMN-dependent monooxygenase n=1 Tax=Streptomyces barringtoniae TaxID=2892029 RepID=UPI001E32BC54|nr:NtaA/DmoA family FMN-dependent monooxygenase [Streptomyces barringtoniae]MCC5474980.1 NtaA/DmoA family FMN-dependent monooxygenase [Streptomyces barringtoniae]
MTVRPQMHLAVRFPAAGDTAAGDTVVRTGPRTGSRIAFPACERLARTAERGRFDFLLLDEGLRLPEHRGRLHELDPVGWPEPVAVLNALAGVTTRLGLAATADTACGEPYELARRIGTLDHLSGGRAAWRVAATPEAAENFRPGFHPEHAPRSTRTAEFVTVAQLLWDSWTPDGTPRPFTHRGRHFDLAGEFGLPRSPQGRPVVIRGDDCEEAREPAAATADVLLTRHAPLAAARARRAELGRRLAAHGRAPRDVKVMPAVTVVLGDTAAEAQERAAGIRRQRVTPQYALYALERLWGVDLCGHDPDGPLPGIAPRSGDRETLARVGRLRALAEEKGLSSRETVIEASGRPSFVGTPDAVAADLDAHVREGAVDGFLLAADGLEEFVDRVVPLLQERGVFRTEYKGATLRSHLGLDHPAREG